LKDGNLVTVGGVLGRRVQNNSHIQLMLVVSRVEIVQEQAIDENEIKRMELRRQKSTKGFKNVDSILEQLLFIDQRPRVALVFAATSITMSDFNAGIEAAKAAIDFFEYRVNFSNSRELSQTLKTIDGQGFNVIALVRGGGGGIEKLDEIEVLETVGNLKTAIIAAIGHVEEKLFIKQLADKEAPTPNGLGSYFAKMVEEVSEKKTKSRAVLTEQIKKQFKDQLEAGQKQNKELQEKLAKLTKTQEEATKQHKEQIEAMQKQHKEQNEKANKQNEELQKKLAELTKTHSEQMGKLQGQLKAQTEASAKQSKEFGESLKKMQDTNGELNKSLQKLTAQNTQAAKDLNEAKERSRQLEKQLEEALSKNKGCSSGCLGMVAAIVTIASAACWIVCLII
jgi:exonuclease VII large subunit